MKNSNINLKLDFKSAPDLLSTFSHRLGRYTLILFLLLVTVVYAFVLLKIDNLSNAQPNNYQISSKVKSVAIPHINPTTVSQIQNLQNNSVSVQALFNQARTNPFQE
ncbi:MAG: hypothetical protein ACREF5_03430 [Candidatus Saccharimonadales bacterium]